MPTIRVYTTDTFAFADGTRDNPDTWEKTNRILYESVADVTGWDPIKAMEVWPFPGILKAALCFNTLPFNVDVQYTAVAHTKRSRQAQVEQVSRTIWRRLNESGLLGEHNCGVWITSPDAYDYYSGQDLEDAIPAHLTEEDLATTD